MDESKLIDWYEVVDAVANGRLTGHACPACGARPLEARKQGANVRVRCPACGEGFEGALAQGRDDSFYAEADALIRRREAAAKAATPSSPGVQVQVVGVEAAPMARPVTTPAAAPATPPPEPWTWQLPPTSRDPAEGYAIWIDVVESVLNGRRTGLCCPFCSEPLQDIFYDDPHVRIRCRMCGEAIEGRAR